ncbi:MAG: hypothetical protein CVU56_03100 [Deltaproteobacteria bacterium HGW-Deltaproteobacteria-14]|nr:MAG: hypothetical protein CVU56_03100 [Deltaproteobacteria bacterium HGW-Deltaproteobacteria-14]
MASHAASDGGDAATPDATADVAADGVVADTAPALRRCNGYPELCARRLDEIVFPATHNSMANADEGWLGPNQTHGLARQLDDGVRALLIDTHAWNGGAYLCHGVCEFGNLPLVDGLTVIREFLDGHPDELVILVIEDHLDTAPTVDAFTASGLDGYLLTLPPGERPPVLADALDAGTRLLVALESGRPPPAWYHHVWDYAFDTPYSFDSPEAFSCECNRGCAGREAKPFFLLNHFITRGIGSVDDAAAVNQREVLLTRALACQEALGHLPNLVAVDFYEQGDLLAVAAELNGVVSAPAPSR